MLFTFHYTEYSLKLPEARTDGQAVRGMGILFTSQIRRLQNIHSRLLQPFVTYKTNVTFSMLCTEVCFRDAHPRAKIKM